LKDEAAKFEELHKKFVKDKADHLQGLKGILVLSSLTVGRQKCRFLSLANWDVTKSIEHVFLLYRHYFKVWGGQGEALHAIWAAK